MKNDLEEQQTNLKREETKKSVTQEAYRQNIQEKAARKIKARNEKDETVWFGIGMMGVIGWSIVIPTLLGVAFGRWLDESYPGSYSWTLMMLSLGLLLGCVNAGHWVKKEERKTHKRK